MDLKSTPTEAPCQAVRMGDLHDNRFPEAIAFLKRRLREATREQRERRCGHRSAIALWRAGDRHGLLHEPPSREDMPVGARHAIELFANDAPLVGCGDA